MAQINQCEAQCLGFARLVIFHIPGNQYIGPLSVGLPQQGGTAAPTEGNLSQEPISFTNKPYSLNGKLFFNAGNKLLQGKGLFQVPYPAKARTHPVVQQRIKIHGRFFIGMGGR